MSLETEYPYQGVTGKCDPSKVKPVAGIRGQVDLPTNDQQALLTAVATVGPIAISVDAGSIGWQLYEGGVLTKGCGADIDHAVQLVGYGETEEKVGYWIVRNSWGASWGEKGLHPHPPGPDGEAAVRDGQEARGRVRVPGGPVGDPGVWDVRHPVRVVVPDGSLAL
eukprot:Sspe_Gene.50857::Locus_28261_Transcript_3_3_Confidence_0.600_Length_1288::g.50857::m.50857